MKRLLSTHQAPPRHWVGDGFHVHGLFGYSGAEVAQRSPFLMLDYAAPSDFPPNPGRRRGVGVHPHRGFETVTIVYDGEVEHRDSTGAGGVIGPGGVQWMTAGGGIVHEEFHSAAYSARGGRFEMVQLWVNLPAKDKMTPAHYQGIDAERIPQVALPDGSGSVRVIAGSYRDPAGSAEAPATQGPAVTYTPMNVWDLRLNAGAKVELAQPEGWSTLIVILAGEVTVQDRETLAPTQYATLSTSGTGVSLATTGAAKVLLLAGQTIDEPVVGYGPFVMNTRQEIVRAVEEYNRGEFGNLQ